MQTRDSISAGPLASFDAICRGASSAGLAVRGAFHPVPGEFDGQLPGVRAATIVLLGFTGSEQWEHFRRSAEAGDGSADPLDRWSRRVIGALAGEVGGIGVYPQGEARPLPFQRFALRSEPVQQSPIGLLIHPTWGLWHAYRGAIVLERRIELPRVEPSINPCQGCAARPCLSSCPVGAFRPGSFDVQACAAHLQSAAGSACREGGCLARRSCPVGTQYRYNEEQMRFHLRAFMASTATAGL
jgi:hypothetical protein